MSTVPEEGASPAPPPVPTIHEADLGSGPTGEVVRGAAIDFDAAVARRRAGDNVIVCGDDTDANRDLARSIESAVGPCQRSDPHKKAGPRVLPHFQPDPRPPRGHTFCETVKRKARRSKK